MPEDTTHIPSIRYLGATTDGRFYWTPWPNAIPGEPKVLTNPTISGTVAPGQTVSAVPGTYTGSPMPTLRRRVWTLYDAAGGIVDEAILLNEGIKIPSNAPTGKLLLQEVMFGVAELKAVGAVEVSFSAIPGLPVFTRAPTISGNATVGNVLTAVHGAAAGSPAPVITGQWYRGTTATGVTALTYPTTSADIGGVMTYRDRANNTAGDAYSSSASITIVAVSQAAPVFTVAPTISVTAGGTFTCSTGTVAGIPTPTLTYLWHLSDTATGTLAAREGGATTVPNTWTPSQSSFPDKFFACQVTASNGIGTPAVVMTARMQRPVQEGFTKAPTLSGGAPQGSTLTLDPGTWYGAPTEIEYQWWRIPTTGDAVKLTTTTETRKTGPDDKDNKIGGRMRIKYASGSEFFSPSATTYTNTITVTAPSVQTGLVVTTVKEFEDGVSAAVKGEIILVAPGNYGDIDLKNMSKNTARTDLDNLDTYVVIKPQDRANPPKIKGTLNITNSSGLWIDGLWFDSRDKKDLKGDDQRCDANGNLIGAVWNTDIVSENYPNGAAVASTDAKGIQLDGGTTYRITITNNLFQFHHRGIEFRSTGTPVHKDIRIIGNEFIEQGMDCINAFRSFDKCVVKNNLFHKSHIDYNRTSEGSWNGSKRVENRHPDQFIQFGLISTSDYTKDCVIQYNWCQIEQTKPGGAKMTDTHAFLTGGAPLTTSNFDADTSHNNMLISNNYISVPDINAFDVQGTWNCTISNNVMRQNGDLTASSMVSPRIVVSGNYHNNLTISNNVSAHSDPVGYSKTVTTATKGEINDTGSVTSKTAFPSSWVTLTKSPGSSTSPSGNVGRYRSGWDS